MQNKKLYQMVGYANELLKINPIDPLVLEAIKGTDSLIYGGYVRDLIAKKFNTNFKEGFKDIDIVALPESKNKILNKLETNGYRHTSDESIPDRYSHWGAVAEVFTLSKPGFPNVQVATVVPKIKYSPTTSKSDLQKELLTPIIAVDIRCCAVAITSNMKIIQLLPYAVQDCKDMIITESKLASHKVNLKERTEKLRSRNWK